jgi:hypothetical protein
MGFPLIKWGWEIKMFERPEVNHSKKTSELRCRV